MSFNTADVVLTTQTSAPSATLKSYTRISSRFSIDVEKAPKKKKKGIRYTDIQLTRSLLVVTWAFILLNIPNYGYRIASILFGISEQVNCQKNLSKYQILYFSPPWWLQFLLELTYFFTLIMHSYSTFTFSTHHRWSVVWNQLQWNCSNVTVLSHPVIILIILKDLMFLQQWYYDTGIYLYGFDT